MILWLEQSTSSYAVRKYHLQRLPRCQKADKKLRSKCEGTSAMRIEEGPPTPDLHYAIGNKHSSPGHSLTPLATECEKKALYNKIPKQKQEACEIFGVTQPTFIIKHSVIKKTPTAGTFLAGTSLKGEII